MVLTAQLPPSHRRPATELPMSVSVSEAIGDAKRAAAVHNDVVLHVPPFVDVSGPTKMDHSMSVGDEVTPRPATPRDRRLRFNSIQSKMDLIQGSMDVEALQRLKKLSQQGAAHYQAEEDFLNLPVLGRSKSAPTSSLAVRYERLRGAPSKVIFQRQAESQPSTQPDVPEPMTSSNHLSPLARCATAPLMRVPTRIIVRPAEGAESEPPTSSEVDAITVPDVADAQLSPCSAERPADFEVPEEARARIGKKRGSDPAVLYVPEVKKLKKKKKGFFRRHRDSYSAESGAESDATTHSAHSTVSEPSEMRPRSWTRRMTDLMSGILRKR